MQIGPLNPTTFGVGAENRQIGIVEAAQEFEALMIGRLLQDARRAGEAFGRKDSETGSETYREMAEEHLARVLAQSGTFGLSRMLIQQLQPDTAPPAGEGDTKGTLASLDS